MEIQARRVIFLVLSFDPYQFSIKKLPKNEVIYFSNIMRRHSCEELDKVNCKKLCTAVSENNISGAKLLRCFKEPDQEMPCRLICRDINCERL